MSIVAEAPGFIQIFSDGTVKRFIPQTATSSTEPQQNTTYKHNSKSKDITIDSSKPITARIFHPYKTETETETESQCHVLPVMLYFHGGGFCIGSTTWLGYHIFLADLSATANIIILSVDYRLAPENKLPIAYEDCFSVLEWLANTSDEWLRRADIKNIFLSGDSAGGNICHNVAMKAMRCKVPVKGIVSIHPYFGSERRTELEMSEDSAGDVAMNDMFWKLSLPDGMDRDFYGCNFEEGGEEVEWRLFPRTLVCVAEKDFLKERGVMYCEFLKRKGVREVSFVETGGESHVFHVWEPLSEATRVFQKQITDFIRSV